MRKSKISLMGLRGKSIGEGVPSYGLETPTLSLRVCGLQIPHISF
jgi:hypothetical protein